MSVETDPLPPAPEHSPPLKEDEGRNVPGRYFGQAWTRWFVSLRAKVNVINDMVANLSSIISSGIVVSDGSGNVSTVGRTDLVAGSNISFTGSGVDRIIDDGSGPLTINAAGGGGGYPFIPPPQTGWSWVNQGGAVVTSDPSYQAISGGSAATLNCRMRTRAAPSTPYVITACIECSMLKNSNSAVALFWRESSTGKLIYAGLTNGNFAAASYNSPTSFAGSGYSVPSYASTLLWHRITDDGTDRGVYFSGNGYDWIPLVTQANNTFLTADEVGFMTLVNGNVLAPTARLVHWEVT